MQNTGYVSLKNLAAELCMDRSHLRKYVLNKVCIEPQQARTADSGSQRTLVVTVEQAERIREHRKIQGFTLDGSQIASESGCFYIIQLIPELDPQRIKFGFAINLNERLMQFRTVAPTAKVLKWWPCKRSWESVVMDCLASLGCRQILNEVYECQALDDLIQTGNAFFNIMPDPNKAVELSEYSPLKNGQAERGVAGKKTNSTF